MGAMVRKELAQLRRDRRTVAMLVAIPLLLLLVFGFAARFEVDRVRTVVGGAGAAAAVERLPQQLEVVATDPDLDRAGAEAWLRAGRAQAALLTGATPRLLVDGTALFAARGVTAAAPAGVEVEVLYNPDLETTPIMIPGLVGLILVFVGGLATSLGVVRERQSGTLEQLAVMPLTPAQVLAGKLAPYLGIALFDLVVVLAAGLVIFDVPFRGDPLVFAVGALLFLFLALSLGLLISSVSENQGQAVQLALMTLLPQVMLSGLIFPLESMALPLQVIGRALPLTWFVQLSRGVMLRGAGWGDVAVPLLVLAGMGAVVFTLAVARFRRDLAPAPRRGSVPAPGQPAAVAP